MFNNSAQKPLNLFNNTNNNTQSPNMFNNTSNHLINADNNNANTNNNGNIFGKTNNNSSPLFNPTNNTNNNTNLFKTNTPIGTSNPTNNIFNKGVTQPANNNGQNGSFFTPNNNQGGNMMGNGNLGQQGGNLFGMTQGNNQGGMVGGILNQNNNNNMQFAPSNPQTNNIFSPQPQQNNQNSFFSPNNQAPLVAYNQSQMINPQTLFTYTPEQQEQILRSYSPEYIKQLLQNCLKELDPKHLQYFTLRPQNILRQEKVTKIAQQFNIKAQLIQVKKQLASKVKAPIQLLKKRKTELETMTNQFAFKVYEKLQVYKARLIESISITKMLNEIKTEIDDIDSQIKDFLKPLFNAHQTRGNHSFLDPDNFCLKISQRILKNMNSLDNRIDELLICEGQVSNEQVDTGEVIQQLVEYYQNVAITLKDFTERYNKMKKLALNRQRYGNPDQILRKIHEKANQNVNKEMQSYELLKQIEGILQKREKKAMQYKF